MKTNNHLIPIEDYDAKTVMISNRISRETKAVIDEARTLAKANGMKISFESIVYEAHAAIIRQLS